MLFFKSQNATGEVDNTPLAVMGGQNKSTSSTLEPEVRTRGGTKKENAKQSGELAGGEKTSI